MINGIWLYGLSGVGKSYISNLLKKRIRKSLIIDGDEVRKFISTDLGYKKKDREIQISRVYGLCKISINSKIFPIASTVYFNNKINDLCNKSSILVIKIKNKKIKSIKKNHPTYKEKINIVGSDIQYPKLKTIELVNDFNKDIVKTIFTKYIKN